MRRESFEHFYLTKIALAEGCGCAEHVTRMREVDAYAERFMRRGPPPLAIWTRLLHRLFGRPSRRNPDTPTPDP